MPHEHAARQREEQAQHDGCNDADDDAHVRVKPGLAALRHGQLDLVVEGGGPATAAAAAVAAAAACW